MSIPSSVAFVKKVLDQKKVVKKGVLDPPKLGLQAVGSNLNSGLGIELGSHLKAARAFKHGASSPDPLLHLAMPILLLLDDSANCY